MFLVSTPKRISGDSISDQALNLWCFQLYSKFYCVPFQTLGLWLSWSFGGNRRFWSGLWCETCLLGVVLISETIPNSTWSYNLICSSWGLHTQKQDPPALFYSDIKYFLVSINPWFVFELQADWSVCTKENLFCFDANQTSCAASVSTFWENRFCCLVDYRRLRSWRLALCRGSCLSA